jgi:hypothetical protein
MTLPMEEVTKARSFEAGSEAKHAHTFAPVSRDDDPRGHRSVYDARATEPVTAVG